MQIQESPSILIEARRFMTRSLESLKVLKSEILDALESLDDLDQKLSALNPNRINVETTEDELILIGYFLSGIYSTFEDIFVKIAKDFENKIEDRGSWHFEILNRMALDIEEVRPAVISKESRAHLDELRRFWHVFRYSYAFELNWEKIVITIKCWFRNSESIQADITNFVNKLDRLAA